jgi:uncharacterized protein
MIDARAWVLRKRIEEAPTRAAPSVRARRGRRSRVRSARPSNLLKVTFAGGAGIALAVLLTSSSMLERALQQPFGEERDAQVAVWERIDEVSETLYLDEPGRAVNEALGRDDAQSEDPLLAFGPGAPANEGTGANVDAPFVLWPAAPPKPELPALRNPTPDAPLRMWIAGDSMAGIFGQALVREANGTGFVKADLDYRISTGLARPDYFNWPAHMKDETHKRQPEVLVVVFGANDSQGLQTRAGDVYQPLTDGWRVEYARRVGATMDLLKSEGRLIFWIGQPIARESEYSERLRDLNTIYAAQAKERSWVFYVDAYSLFADKNGDYTAYMRDGNGDVELVREQDGVHLTWAGGERLAGAVLYLLGLFADFSAEPAHSPAQQPAPPNASR